MEFFEKIKEYIIYCSLPGIAGGVTLFIWSLKKGHYKNNKYTVKFMLESIGAMITATFLASLLDNSKYQVIGAYLIGVSWASIIQSVRNKITKIVEATLGEEFKRN